MCLPVPWERRPGSFLLRDDCWGSGGSLDSDGAPFGGRVFTSAAFCTPEAGFAALMLLVLSSATHWDIQTRAGGSNMHRHTKLLSAFTFIMLSHSDMKPRTLSMEAILMLIPAKMASC